MLQASARPGEILNIGPCGPLLLIPVVMEISGYTAVISFKIEDVFIAHTVTGVSLINAVSVNISQS